MLIIENLNVNIGAIAVLRDVSLTVGRGEIVTLLGANGAGKTTLVRTISGQLKPASGKIEYEGTRIDGISPRKIVATGIVQCPEGRQLFQTLTVEENLRLAGSRPGLKWSQCRFQLPRIFALFPILRERWTQAAGSLSGGEQQMVALARALIVEPKLLIIDEVSLGLAPALIDRLFQILPTLVSPTTSMLLVEQQARAALRLAARAYVLAHGKIVIYGSAEHVRRTLESGAGYFNADLAKAPEGQAKQSANDRVISDNRPS